MDAVGIVGKECVTVLGKVLWCCLNRCRHLNSIGPLIPNQCLNSGQFMSQRKRYFSFNILVLTPNVYNILWDSPPHSEELGQVLST